MDNAVIILVGMTMTTTMVMTVVHQVGDVEIGVI